MGTEMFDVLGIGNAIVDVTCSTTDEFLHLHGLAKGSMTLIDAEQAENLYVQIKPTVECSGGSAANTMVGLASLGAKSSYIGKVKDDPLGRKFCQDIRAASVDFAGRIETMGLATGRCLVLVSPDASRTMLTFLGACSTLSPLDIDPDRIQSARIIYLEGYLWDPPPAKEAFIKVAEVAHAAGRQVAISLSDSFCVDRHRDSLSDLIDRHIDILFGNEDEVLSLFKADDLAAAVQQLQGQGKLAVITRGKRGSMIVFRQQVIEVEAMPVPQVVDTTGAGDLFASGFLWGLSKNRDLGLCGRLGSIAAGEIIGHFGARPLSSLRELVASTLK